MATLKDIAQRAGVTATTVSRVINNRGYISEGTRKKVYAAMEEMHYQPNELARAFSKQYTNTIGLIVPHISHPFFTKVISNIESSAAEKGFKLLLCNSKEQPEKEQDYLDMCMSNRVAGIVLCSKYVQTREFRKMNIPVVNLERGEDDDTISVQCDNYQGGKLAAEHLIECGCKNLFRILFVLFEAEVCVCDLAAALQMTQSAISHQLRILKQNKLVKSRREGKSIFYSLADGHVRTIINQGLEHIEED